MKLRAGYQAFWLVDVTTSQDQIDFNLANKAGTQNHTGSIFYHGPMIEMQFLF